MTKTHVSLNLTNYTILTPNITREALDASFRKIITWLKTEQDYYYQHHFTTLVERFMSGRAEFKGSLNMLGRDLGIEPGHKAEKQPWNLHEMFRVSILAKVGGYLQNELLTELIMESNAPLDELDPKELIEEYEARYPAHKTPTKTYVGMVLQRLSKGVLHGLPSGDGVLPLWASDTHYCKLARDKRDVFLTISLPDVGRVTLGFVFPKSERFADGKTTRPNVRLDRKTGKLTFNFTVQKPAPLLSSRGGVMGVDLNKAYDTAVGTVIWGEDREYYSAPMLPNKTVRYLSHRIKNLTMHVDSLYAKEVLNRARGHDAKADVLRGERLRVRSKRARLKVERGHHVANQIVTLASRYDALIALEELSWSESGAWDRARTQDMIEHKARSKGLRSRKVNAANTSQLCPKCGVRVAHAKRFARCGDCQSVVDRDILASRNIAKRALPKKFDFSRLTQVSLPTRVMRPVTPGSAVAQANSRNTLSSITRNTT